MKTWQKERNTMLTAILN